MSTTCIPWEVGNLAYAHINFTAALTCHITSTNMPTPSEHNLQDGLYNIGDVHNAQKTLELYNTA